MKIALVTIHATTNYGGVFQAFATQEVLKEFGDVRIIDYRNPYIDKTVQVVRLGYGVRDFLRIVKDIYRVRSRRLLINSFKRFFKDNYLLTPRVISASEFGELASAFDVFFCGSDQIWNPWVVSEKGELDTHYLLDFAPEGKKISYASSIGSYDFKVDGDAKRILGSLLAGFSAISVREPGTANIVSSLSGIEVEAVLDPTFLLEKSQWLAKLGISESKREDYIFVYALKKDRLLKKTVDFFSKKTGMKVIAVDQDPFLGFGVDTHYKSLPPEHFLELLVNSKFVVTNSFHGCAFSLNFNKNFVATTPPSSPNRVVDLLESTGMKARLISGEVDHKAAMLEDVDFTEANMRLGLLKEKSYSYISRSLAAV